MRWPDLGMIAPGRGNGAGAEGGVQWRLNGTNHKPQGATADLLAVHYCTCRHGVICVFCLRQNRTIRAIEARRADPVWRQTPERRVAAGGAWS